MGEATHTYCQEKLEELILYIANQSEADARFGATKLNKLLFFSDFSAYARTGKPITGVVYRKMPYGPVPETVEAVKFKLLNTKDLIEERRRVISHHQHRLVATREPDLSLFTAQEISIVDQIITRFHKHNNKTISEISHMTAGWQLAESGEVIPYETVILSPVDAMAELTIGDFNHGKEVLRRLNAA